MSDLVICKSNFIKLTLDTLMVGNMFWNIFAINFRCIPSPEKLFITIKGELSKAFFKKYCFFKLDMTSLVNEKFCTLNVSVGPLGNLATLK